MHLQVTVVEKGELKGSTYSFGRVYAALDSWNVGVRLWMSEETNSCGAGCVCGDILQEVNHRTNYE